MNIAVLAVSILFIYPMGVLWFRQMVTFFTNKTTTERFGRKRMTRSESESENVSTTTSILAEQVVEKIGGR